MGGGGRRQAKAGEGRRRQAKARGGNRKWEKVGDGGRRSEKVGEGGGRPEKGGEGRARWEKAGEGGRCAHLEPRVVECREGLPFDGRVRQADNREPTEEEEGRRRVQLRGGRQRAEGDVDEPRGDDLEELEDFEAAEGAQVGRLVVAATCHRVGCVRQPRGRVIKGDVGDSRRRRCEKDVGGRAGGDPKRSGEIRVSVGRWRTFA